MAVRCAKFDRTIADTRCVNTQELHLPVCNGCKEGKAAKARTALVVKSLSGDIAPQKEKPKEKPIPSDMQMLASSPQVAQLLYDLELLLKSQCGLIFSLAHEGKLSEALKRMQLTNEVINQSLTGDGSGDPSTYRSLSTKGSK